MGDRVATFTIQTGAEDDGTIAGFLNSIRTQFKSAVADIQATTGKLDLFGQISDNLPKIQRAIDSAKAQISSLTAEVDKFNAAGQKAPDALIKSLADAEKALKSATTEMARQSQQAATLQSSLSRAGVDTSNYALAQVKLADSLKLASAAATENAAKQALGLKTLSDVQPQIAKITAAYDTLRTSGTLSSSELAQAQAAASLETEKLLGSVTNLKTGFVGAASEGLTFAQGLRANFLTITLAVTGVIAAVSEVVAKAKEFNQGLGEIGAATNLTQDQLAALGEGVRGIARQFGVDIPAAFATVKDSLRAGLDPDGALAKLAIDAEAAKAANADLNAVAKLGTDIISAYRVPVSQLQGSYDQLFTSAKNGGPLLGELGDQFGKLLTTAKGSNIPFEVVVASLESINSAVHNSGDSISLLQNLILKFDTASVQAKLSEAGIAVNDFKGTIDALRAGNLALPEFTELGLASAKAGIGIEALVNGSKPLPAALRDIAAASGSVAEGYAKMEQTPTDQIAKLKSAVGDLLITLGNTGPVSGFVTVLTGAANAVNQLAEAERNRRAESKLAQDILTGETLATNDFGEAQIRAAQATKEEIAAQKEAAAAAKASGDAIALAAQQYNDAKAAVDALSKVLGGISTLLQADAKAIAESAAKQIADATKVADEQIAALDRSTAAARATAATTVDIQTQLAKDRLAIIQTSAADIAKATDAAIAAETAARTKNGELTKQQEAKLQADIAQIRLNASQQTVALYQATYDTLVAQEQGYAAKLQALGNERLAFNQSIEKQLFDIRIATLSSFDQYVAKSQEADRLVSLSRQAADQGDSANAKKYGDEAIAIANTLGVTYSTNGSIIVTQTQAQQEKLKILKAVSDTVNASFENAGSAAEKGYILSNFYAKLAKQDLDDQIAKLKQAQAEAEKGLHIKVLVDIDSYLAAKQKFDELTADRTLKVKVVYDTNAPGAPGFVGPPAPAPLASGGFVSSLLSANRTMGAIRQYANGGGVFREPTWTKVPGSGDGDTVPARLSIGSFVMRKAASMYYGDGIMGQLARFASGGAVTDPYETAAKTHKSEGRLRFDDGALRTAYADLMEEINLLFDSLRGLVAGPAVLDSGTPMGDWLNIIVRSFGQYSPAHRKLIASVFDSSYTGWLDNIELAKKWHTGVSIWPNIPNTIAGKGIDLANLATVFGRGGGMPGATDSVKALLTPGEFVLKPSAVGNALKMFGGGFLDALNQMRVPKGFLDNVIAPRPMRFAEGGVVPGGPAISMSGAAVGGGSVTVNVYPQRFDEQTFNQEIVPRFNKLVNRSK